MVIYNKLRINDVCMIEKGILEVDSVGEMDIRWIQRFSNYKKAFSQLEEAVNLMNKRELSRLEKQGVIHTFEYTHELAWKTMKDFFEDRGQLELYGSKDVTRKAFELGLIKNGDIWMQMVKSRNLTSHTYNESTLEEILILIKNDYYTEFKLLKEKMHSFLERLSCDVWCSRFNLGTDFHSNQQIFPN